MTNPSFLGIPVNGDINRNDRTDQRPLSELEPLIRAVLDDPNVHSFAWRQYTPYFNDGEPCIFRVCQPSFRAARPDDQTVQLLPADNWEEYEGDEDDERHDYEFEVNRYNTHPVFGGHLARSTPYVGDYRETHERCLELSDALESGAFDDVLINAFGDHAEVTAKRSGFTVREYSHD